MDRFPCVLQDFVPFGAAALLPLNLIRHYSSRARVPLTTYCLWAAIKIALPLINRSRRWYKIKKVYNHSHFEARPEDSYLTSDLSTRLAGGLAPGFPKAKFPSTYNSLRAVTCQGGRVTKKKNTFDIKMDKNIVS